MRRFARSLAVSSLRSTSSTDFSSSSLLFHDDIAKRKKGEKGAGNFGNSLKPEMPFATIVCGVCPKEEREGERKNEREQ